MEMLECWLLVGGMLFSYQLTGHLTLNLEAEASFLSFERILWKHLLYLSNLELDFLFLIGHFRTIFEMVCFLIKYLRSHAKWIGLSFRNLIFTVRRLCSSDIWKPADGCILFEIRNTSFPRLACFFETTLYFIVLFFPPRPYTHGS